MKEVIVGIFSVVFPLGYIEFIDRLLTSHVSVLVTMRGNVKDLIVGIFSVVFPLGYIEFIDRLLTPLNHNSRYMLQ